MANKDRGDRRWDLVIGDINPLLADGNGGTRPPQAPPRPEPLLYPEEVVLEKLPEDRPKILTSAKEEGTFNILITRELSVEVILLNIF